MTSNKLLLVFTLLTSVITTGCPLPGGGGGELEPWDGYPSLHENGTFSRWLVLKCTFSDDRNTRTLPTDLDDSIVDLDDYIEKFLTLEGAGTGNLVDYLHDVTYGKLEFVTKVMGWYPAPFASNTTLSRKARIEQCANAMTDADAASIAFEDYEGIIMVTNRIQDGGACQTGKASFNIKGRTYQLGCLTFDSNAMYTSFAAHELGHGLGLFHSADTSLVDYTDQFDIMSALNVWMFASPNYPGEGAANATNGSGPGMSVPNLFQLNAIPAARIATYNVGGAQQDFTLTALSHPLSPYSLALQIVGPNLAAPYTVEYRQADGWDAGFPRNLVLIHKYVAGGKPSSIALNGPTVPSGGATGGWAQDQLWINYQEGLSVHVKSINPAAGTAVVTVNTL